MFLAAKYFIIYLTSLLVTNTINLNIKFRLEILTVNTELAIKQPPKI